MIEFKIVKNSSFGTVMNKFTAFIKKSGIVFIGFNYKTIAITQTGRHTKVKWYTTD